MTGADPGKDGIHEVSTEKHVFITQALVDEMIPLRQSLSQERNGPVRPLDRPLKALQQRTNRRLSRRSNDEPDGTEFEEGTPLPIRLFYLNDQLVPKVFVGSTDNLLGTIAVIYMFATMRVAFFTVYRLVEAAWVLIAALPPVYSRYRGFSLSAFTSLFVSRFKIRDQLLLSGLFIALAPIIPPPIASALVRLRRVTIGNMIIKSAITAFCNFHDKRSRDPPKPDNRIEKRSLVNEDVEEIVVSRQENPNEEEKTPWDDRSLLLLFRLDLISTSYPC